MIIPLPSLAAWPGMRASWVAHRPGGRLGQAILLSTNSIMPLPVPRIQYLRLRLRPYSGPFLQEQGLPALYVSDSQGVCRPFRRFINQRKSRGTRCGFWLPLPLRYSPVPDFGNSLDSIPVSESVAPQRDD